MLDITAANTRNLPTYAKPPGPKTYAKKTEAQFAAVATLGQMARDGFEYTVQKCDGRWFWTATDPDKVPPDTAAEIKTNGGKRHMTANDAVEAAIAAGLSAKGLRKIAETVASGLLAKNGPSEPAHAPKPESAVPQPTTPETSPAKPAGAVLADLAAKTGWQASAPTVRTVGDVVAEAINAGVTPGQVAADLAGLGANPFAIPTFLQRENNPETKKRVSDIIRQTNPRTRPLKNPPDRKPQKVPDGGRRLTEKEITEIVEGIDTKQRRKPTKSARGRTKAPHGVVVGETVASAPKAKLSKDSMSKIELIAALLTRKEGCTATDVLTLTGWPSVSMPACAKAAKLNLRKEKDGKLSRYWGTPF